MKFHPIAELFPLIEGDEFEKLVADIKAQGLLDPIVMFEGKILDGRNRWRACTSTEPWLSDPGQTAVEFQGEDPIAFVLSKNLHRRHLTTSQRGMIANQMVTLPWGRHPEVSEVTSTQRQAAKALDVSRRLVARARKVEREAPELVEPIKRGELTVGAALKQIKADLDKPKVRERNSWPYKKLEEPIPVDPVIQEWVRSYADMTKRQRKEALKFLAPLIKDEIDEVFRALESA